MPASAGMTINIAVWSLMNFEALAQERGEFPVVAEKP